MEERKEFICKDDLRRELIVRRAHIADKPERSRLAAERLIPMLNGKTMIYISIGSELSTEELVRGLLERADIETYAPFTSGGIITPRRLIKFGKADRFGNLDESCYLPCSAPVEIDVCVVPLLGYNGEGYRIGYGQGCYDRFLTQNGAYKIGLAFDAQFAEFSPDSKVIYFKANAGNIV